MRKLILATGLAVFSMSSVADAGFFDDWERQRLQNNIAKLEQQIADLNEQLLVRTTTSQFTNIQMDIIQAEEELKYANERLARLNVQAVAEPVDIPPVEEPVTVTPPTVTTTKPTVNLADAFKQLGVQGGGLGLAGGTVAASVAAVAIGQALQGQGGNGNGGSTDSTATPSTGSTN